LHDEPGSLHPPLKDAMEKLTVPTGRGCVSVVVWVGCAPSTTRSLRPHPAKVDFRRNRKRSSSNQMCWMVFSWRGDLIYEALWLFLDLKV
jgi:hypothetical protein